MSEHELVQTGGYMVPDDPKDYRFYACCKCGFRTEWERTEVAAARVINAHIAGQVTRGE